MRKIMAKKITDDGEVIDEITHEVVARAPIFFKTPFNHDTDAESLATALTCRDPSKTQQSHLADSDINNILRKFMATGELPVTGQAEYGERDERDLQELMVTGYDVEQAWDKLPIEAKAILQTPKKFVEWYDQCLETGNLDGLRQIGLLPPEEASEPPKPASPPGGSPAPAPEPEPQAPK